MTGPHSQIELQAMDALRAIPQRLDELTKVLERIAVALETQKTPQSPEEFVTDWIPPTDPKADPGRRTL